MQQRLDHRLALALGGEALEHREVIEQRQRVEVRVDAEVLRQVAEHRFDPRLVGTWSYSSAQGRLSCETTLPDGVEALVPPPVETRVRIGGAFLDEVQIRLSSTSFLQFPVEAHRGELASDGTVTIRTKMPTAVALFAEGRLPPIGGAPVDLMIGGKEVGAMVLGEVRCPEHIGSHETVELVLRPSRGDGTDPAAEGGTARG